MDGFYNGAELRRMMSTIEWPDTEEYHNMLKSYRDAFQDPVLGTRTSDVESLGHAASSLAALTEAYDGSNMENLDRNMYDLLLKHMPDTFASFYADSADGRPRISPGIQRITTVLHQGLTFGTKKGSNRNSYVLYSLPEDLPGKNRAGQICDIILHQRFEFGSRIVSAFVVVDQFTELSALHASQDPFRHGWYEELHTRLCYRSTAATHFIPLHQIHAHFAALIYTPANIGEECIVVRSLDQVSVQNTTSLLHLKVTRPEQRNGHVVVLDSLISILHLFCACLFHSHVMPMTCGE